MKRYVLANHKKPWRNLKGTPPCKRNPSEEATYCMVPTEDNLEEAKLKRQTDQWFPGAGGRGRASRQDTEDVEGSGTILQGTRMVDTHHCPLVRTHGTYNPGSEL